MLSDSLDEKISKDAYEIFKKVFLPSENFWKDLDTAEEKVDYRVKNEKLKIKAEKI